MHREKQINTCNENNEKCNNDINSNEHNKEYSKKKKIWKKKFFWFSAFSCSALIWASAVVYNAYTKITNVPPSGMCIINDEKFRCIYFGKNKERINEIKEAYENLFQNIPISFALLFPDAFKGKTSVNSGFHESFTGIIGIVLDDDAKLNAVHELFHKIFDELLSQAEKQDMLYLIKKTLMIVPEFGVWNQLYNSIDPDFITKSFDEQVNECMLKLKINDRQTCESFVRLIAFNSKVKLFLPKKALNELDLSDISEVYANFGTEMLHKKPLPAILFKFYEKTGAIKRLDIDNNSLTIKDLEKIKMFMHKMKE
ncbi:MAG: hypothetical protein QXS91_02370 [Candidatus Anstonellales archaeon]